MSPNIITEFVSERPKLMNALWTIALVGSMIGAGVAAGGGATSGP